MAYHTFKKMPLASKTGGGRVKPVQTEGNKGVPSGGTYPPKSQLGKTKGNIDSPGMKGDMGIPSGAAKTKKAPLD